MNRVKMIVNLMGEMTAKACRDLKFKFGVFFFEELQ